MQPTHRFSIKELDQLAGDPAAKDALICTQWGVTPDELRRVRATSTFSAVHHAAELIGRKGRPEHITHLTLGAILYREWNSPRGRATAVHTLLQGFYREAVESRHREWGLKVPAIQCLREAVLGYTGNLYEATQAWPGIRISDTDLAKNLRLPLTIGREEAYVLGVIWADGMVDHDLRRHSIKLTGGSKDHTFYNKRVAPSINGIFNTNTEPSEAKPGKGWGPIMSINSQAITTWMHDMLGFPHPKENVGLPKIEWTHEQREGFLNGIFDAMGSLAAYRPGTAFRLSLYDSDKTFIKNIEAVSRIEGLAPKDHLDLENGSNQLSYRTPAVREAYQRGLLTHPAWKAPLSILTH